MIRSEELVDLSVPSLFEADLSTLSLNTETLVVSAVGSFNACDVWFTVPSGWPADFVFRLYARLLDARVLLKQVDLSETHRTLASGNNSGIAASVRGRPVTAFELTVETRTALSGTGRLMLQAWAGAQEPRVLGAGAGAAQPSAEESLIAVRSGGLPVLVAGDSSGRLTVAGGGTPASPAGGVVSVQGPLVATPAYAALNRFAVRPSVTANNTTNILTLRSASTKRVEIRKILISYQGAIANVDGRILVLLSSAAPNPSTGTAFTPVKFNGSNPTPTAGAISGSSAAGTMTAITWAPTATDIVWSSTVRCDDRNTLILDRDAWAQPLTLRTTQETLGIQFVCDTGGSGTFSIAATIHFIEI